MRRGSVEQPLSISVVIPVYNGALTLPDLVEELARYRAASVTPNGRFFRIDEVLLVWDRGIGGSDQAIRSLCDRHEWVRPIWLSRNFGQHPATLAGMTSAGGDWIVTMDEDGQHDPAYIDRMLDTAYDERAQVVYAAPTQAAPHGRVRNLASQTTKWLFVRVLSSGVPRAFHSYRIMLGEVARSVAAYVGPDVYLDVALSWVVADTATCPVPMRTEGRPAGSYTYRRLIGHFWRLVVSSGTRPLRAVSATGLLAALGGFVLSAVTIVRRIDGNIPVQGWTSAFVALLIIGGAILFALGVIAEYIAAATTMAMGKPTYVIVQDPRSVYSDDEDA